MPYISASTPRFYNTSAVGQQCANKHI